MQLAGASRFPLGSCSCHHSSWPLGALCSILQYRSRPSSRQSQNPPLCPQSFSRHKGRIIVKNIKAHLLENWRESKFKEINDIRENRLFYLNVTTLTTDLLSESPDYNFFFLNLDCYGCWMSPSVLLSQGTCSAPARSEENLSLHSPSL